jgi:DNA-binding MarR family transcriptional regulator
MDDELLTSWICTALMRIGTRMATGFDQHFASLGITQSQFRILLSIYEMGGAQGIAPSVLADHLLIERGTISVLSNRMIEKGWIMRVSGGSRRTFRLILTEEGGALLQKAIPRAIRLADHTISEIPRDQLNQMRANLEWIEDRLRAFEPLKD